jgi:ribulose-5-phosphate 4-epimerase/fuculose-1-phosphate aldolase
MSCPETGSAAAAAAELAIAAGRVLAVAGQGDLIWGHAAVRDPGGRGIWIKEPGWGLEEVGADQIQLVSFEGQVVRGRGQPHKECWIHLAVLSANPELTCSVHTHARPAVAFAALGVPLLPVSHEGALFGGADVPRFTLTGGLVSTPELGDALARTLGTAPAALMPRHGLVAAGESVPAAVMHAVLLAAACEVQLRAMAAGDIRVWSDQTEARAKQADCWPPAQLEAGWHYLLRQTTKP